MITPGVFSGFGAIWKNSATGAAGLRYLSDVRTLSIFASGSETRGKVHMPNGIFMKGLAATLLLLSGPLAFAGFKGSISFTEDQKARHAAGVPVISETAAACLRADLEHHQRFYARYGISPYYGSNSPFKRLSDAERRADLRRRGLDPRLVDQMKSTSCIGLAMKCLDAGFRAANQSDLWATVKKYVGANDGDGTALQFALRTLGWKILYWNPDTRMNEFWDSKEKAANPSNSDKFWGYHAAWWKRVQRDKTYYYNIIDDQGLLVDFGTNTPVAFRQIPFFVGTAHMGYHVFPGAYGQVIEGHSMRQINDPQTIESSPFNPMANGGGPRGQYFSGIIAVPPGARF